MTPAFLKTFYSEKDFIRNQTACLYARAKALKSIGLDTLGEELNCIAQNISGAMNEIEKAYGKALTEKIESGQKDITQAFKALLGE